MLKFLFLFVLFVSGVFGGDVLYKSAPGEPGNPIFSCLERKYIENRFRNPQYVMTECIYEIIIHEQQKSFSFRKYMDEMPIPTEII
jgi:hypothetical protein